MRIFSRGLIQVFATSIRISSNLLIRFGCPVYVGFEGQRYFEKSINLFLQGKSEPSSY